MSHSRANHVTPQELSERSGFSDEEIRHICVAESVALFHGRIDASLFMLAASAAGYQPGEVALAA